ncbi:Prephenate dehydratase-domain-containing protein [Fomitopsis serialis]|uniref:Prephenate dehydratase-domain-containing protein n=1 Tax=Fomitopsis serialis TaxID=139415 RepID=UPI002008D91E|nr:Prephenate dehydratase-domain-containing protein [Neoantrodia serialis]KAH9937077.1 Prephenate dehydratase-domain-containing protein [Neoantrodia serialis]
MTAAGVPAQARLPGPLGSHSYQCAKTGFGSSVEYVERPSITEVFNAVSPDVPFGLLPQENSVFGTVTETYDLLRLPEVGTGKFIRGELVLPIRHSLVVRRGVKLEDVERVLSHEQALGQCSRFLSERLPGAARVKTPSTSAAAKSLLSAEDEDTAARSAAICSIACTTVFDGLEVLQEGIQNVDTRARAHQPQPSPSPSDATANGDGGEIGDGDGDGDESTAPPRTRGRLVHLVMSTLLTTFGLPTSRVDRRPSLTDTPFEDVYLWDAASAALWARVKAGVEKIGALGGEAAVLGIW